MPRISPGRRSRSTWLHHLAAAVLAERDAQVANLEQRRAVAHRTLRPRTSASLIICSESTVITIASPGNTVSHHCLVTR